MIVDHGEQTLDLPSRPTRPTVVWLFGRGLSIECGLTWKERPKWEDLPRMVRIERIKRELLFEMDSPDVDTSPIKEFLAFLAQLTTPQWQHLFVTTNWDYLLQRELRASIRGPKVPLWLHHGAGSHVHHLNGSVEEGTQHRSPFMLEDDCGSDRPETTEANYAFGYLSCARTFVVAGMSLECDTDRHFLRQLSKVQKWMPIGESHWIIANPREKALRTVCCLIHEALPEARVEPVKATLADWRKAKFPELSAEGVFRD